jgi:hypothetical protein
MINLRNQNVEAIWNKLFDYIATEDDPEYSETEMEKLCSDVLPQVWDLILKLEANLDTALDSRSCGLDGCLFLDD